MSKLSTGAGSGGAGGAGGVGGVYGTGYDTLQAGDDGVHGGDARSSSSSRSLSSTRSTTISFQSDRVEEEQPDNIERDDTPLRSTSGSSSSSSPLATTIMEFLVLFFGKPAMSRLRTKLGLILACEFAFLLFGVLSIAPAHPMETGDAAIDLSPPLTIAYLSITPRSLLGLLGIFFFPFIHATFLSALVDVFSFFILGFLVLLRPHGLRTFTSIWLVYQFVGGAFVWLLGRSSVHHTGCGGWIFAMFFYLVVFGAFRRDARSIIVSIAVFIMYSGMVWGMLPSNAPQVSHEAHLAGLILGCTLGAYEGGFTYTENDSLDELRERLRAFFAPLMWRQTSAASFVRVETAEDRESAPQGSSVSST